VTEAERERLQKVAEAMTIKQNEEGRPGKLSVNDIAVTAIRRYLKELEEAGVIEPGK
jgi:predicted transcriptional regulator